MKQLVTQKPHQLVMCEAPRPEIGQAGEVLVKVKAAGICGSDVHIYHGTSPVATYPRVMGHEVVGVVEQIGDGVTKVKPGDHVIVDQVISCGHCYPCSIGRPNVCCHLQVRGVHVDGGYREYMVVDETALHLLPQDLPFADAIMIEPLSIAFQAKDRAQITARDTVFILGAGALGKSLIKAVLLTGAKIIVADVVEERLAEAAELGAHHTVNSAKTDMIAAVRELTGGYGPTVSIDGAGIVDSLAQLAEVTCNAGRVITMAFLEQPSPVAQFKITAKELDVRGSRLQCHKFEEVIAAYRDKKIDLSGLVSHRIPFAEAQQAFDRIDARDTSIKKVALLFD
ncbi:MAG: zinc-binding alcohol dehydrogenase family protein [Sporomusaceae bacterium]|nr:zinc-binding alcohol dehydrogenase family protein [Sporomusaceae bacterium]